MGGKKQNRYAVLFAPHPELRSFNDLELLYRLLRKYDFKDGNIFVLCYDGTFTILKKTNRKWKKEKPKYYPLHDHKYKIKRKKILPATQERLEVLFALREPRSEWKNDPQIILKSDDFLYIHVDGHAEEGKRFPYLPCHDGNKFDAFEFASTLNTLPEFAQLLVTMDQCFAGVFLDLLRSSKAKDSVFISGCGGKDDPEIMKQRCTALLRPENLKNLFMAFTYYWNYEHLDADNKPKKVSVKKAFEYVNTKITQEYAGQIPGYHEICEDPEGNCGYEMWLGGELHSNNGQQGVIQAILDLSRRIFRKRSK